MSTKNSPKPKLNFMLDLETVDISNTAGIIALAAVPFMHPEVLPSFYQKCSLQSVEAEDFSVSREVLDWWSRQPKEVRNEAFSGTQHINELLAEFDTYIRSFKEFTPVIWGNGSMFDNTILINAFDRFGMTVPWSYKNDRCFRTLKEVFDFVPAPVFIGDKHNALADATWQARYAEKILRYLERVRESVEGYIPAEQLPLDLKFRRNSP